VTGRELIKFEVDGGRMVVRIGVLPSSLALETARAWTEMSVLDFQDMAAQVTLGVNGFIRQASAEFARNGGLTAAPARPT
jgi:hypothetical protein